MRRRNRDEGPSSRVHSRCRVAGFCAGVGLIRTNPQRTHSTTLKIPGLSRNLSRPENNTAPAGLKQHGQRSASGGAGSLLGALSCCTINYLEIQVGRAAAAECRHLSSLGADHSARSPPDETPRAFLSSKYPNGAHDRVGASNDCANLSLIGQACARQAGISGCSVIPSTLNSLNSLILDRIDGNSLGVPTPLP